MTQLAQTAPELPLGRRSVSIADIAFAIVLAVLAGLVYQRLGVYMDIYEIAILAGVVPLMAWLGWLWRPLRWLMIGVGVASGLAIFAYGGQAVNAEEVFVLKYLFSSQTSIILMCLAFVLAFVSYWLGLLTRFSTAEWLGTVFMWTGVFFGTTALMVRWYESYLLGSDVGHIPVSNLYEVMVLFVIIVGIFYLYYEQAYRTRALGGFISFITCASVAFLLWYAYARNAHDIQPLVPALQSWWMKLHVPANFIGYGTFAIAAMVAFAYIVVDSARSNKSPWGFAIVFILGVLLCIQPFILTKKGVSDYWMIQIAIASVLVGIILLLRKLIADRLPELHILEDIMYKAIAIGFALFTVATILGAFWANDAWGTYWQWDPKETWALIVWLNYAAWLHMRLMKGLRGVTSAYWALIGLLITGFAFFGVNIALSGLHSYGAI